MNDQPTLENALQLAACVLFFVGLRMLRGPATAVRGNAVSAAAMAIAVAAAVIATGVSLTLVAASVAVGASIGLLLALRVKMTGMPELVALFNGLGGLASATVGLVELIDPETTAALSRAPAAAAVVVGAIAFTGSLVAYGKLSGRIETKAIVFPLQLALSAAALLITLGLGVGAVLVPESRLLLALLSLLALVLGVLAVVRIGGGDMPVVVSLLNAYSGIAAALAGLALASPVLVVAGTLVGASGLMLTGVMCKGMNRSLADVLFAGFGSEVAPAGAAQQGEVRPVSAPDAFLMLEAARSVVIVPGYGMAVAQAQHVVQELAEMLAGNGTDVSFVIHPVAGRMPGHMNVLLAEAGVPYEQLAEPQDVNPNMAAIDLALVIGANDVVNPDAREDESSPLYGMPIVNVDQARTTIVLKRSMNPGFAGVQNSLFFKPNTRLLFGDAKKSIAEVLAEFKSD
ncbi:MAG: NAD(P)(+) transhydrogenase (Re/Si-specific) subunit beta [Planctomycetota bacterium]